jgi:hypothetical protein
LWFCVEDASNWYAIIMSHATDLFEGRELLLIMDGY